MLGFSTTLEPFLINFSMDAVSLYLSARLCSAKLSVLRISVGAALGGIYSVLSIFLGLDSRIELFVFMLVCIIMSTIALSPDGLLLCLKYSVVMFISSCLLGGIMTVLYSAFNEILRGHLGISEAMVPEPLVFAVLCMVSMACALFLCRLHGSGAFPDSVDCEITLFGKCVVVRGIVDSGNMLKDPLSGKNVIVVSTEFFRGVLSREFLLGVDAEDVGAVNVIKSREKRRFRLVPAKGIGASTYLFGVVPDDICIAYEKKGRIVKKRTDAVVALVKDKNLGGEIRCIVPQSII